MDTLLGSIERGQRDHFTVYQVENVHELSFGEEEWLATVRSYIDVHPKQNLLVIGWQNKGTSLVRKPNIHHVVLAVEVLNSLATSQNRIHMHHPAKAPADNTLRIHLRV